MLGLDARDLFFLANPETKSFIFRNKESTGDASTWETFCMDENLRKIHNISE